jgi:hypothetical protein
MGFGHDNFPASVGPIDVVSASFVVGSYCPVRPALRRRKIAAATNAAVIAAQSRQGQRGMQILAACKLARQRMARVGTYDGDGRIWLNVDGLQVRVELARNLYRASRLAERSRKFAAQPANRWLLPPARRSALHLSTEFTNASQPNWNDHDGPRTAATNADCNTRATMVYAPR